MKTIKNNAKHSEISKEDNGPIVNALKIFENHPSIQRASGSILASLLFNIFICDLFMFLLKDTITNYTDDNTPYSSGDNIHNTITNLEQASNILLKWFIDNYLKSNLDKYYFLLNEKFDAKVIVKDSSIPISNCQKLLGIKIDQKLFLNHD